MAPMAASLIAPMASSLIQPVAFSLINAIFGKVVMKVGKGRDNGFLFFLALRLIMKVLGKGVTKAVTRYNEIDHMEKKFSAPSFKQYQNY